MTRASMVQVLCRTCFQLEQGVGLTSLAVSSHKWYQEYTPKGRSFFSGIEYAYTTIYYDERL